MDRASGIQQYQRTDIQTASPLKIVVQLYEALQRHTLQAATALQAGDLNRHTRSVNAAQAIVMELNNALDYQQGEQIAENLAALYDFMFQEYLALITDRNPKHLQDILVVLRPLLQAWQSVSDQIGHPARDGFEPSHLKPDPLSGPDPATEPAAGDDAQHGASLPAAGPALDESVGRPVDDASLSKLSVTA